MIGTRIGTYEVVAELGRGGMGEVYRARDTRLGRDVAIKALPAAVASDPERTARFEREAKVLASLNHPHIAAIYGLEESGSGRYLILELVEGGSLADRLNAGPMPLDEAVGVARQVLDALEAAHEKGIVHRDLKPANIMLTTDGVAKVLDFGLARLTDEPSGQDVSNSPTMTATQAGMILGTAAYMSPEQARGRVADKRSDVWSFGCVFYEMLTGKRLFAGEDVSETLAFVLTKVPDAGTLPASVPPRVGTLLMRCLERDRKARIPEVSAVRFLLDEALTPASALVPAPPVTTPRPSSRRLLSWAAVPAAIVLAAAAAWLLKPVPVAPVGRFEIAGANVGRLVASFRQAVAISPDGRRIAYVTSGGGLVVQALSEFEGKVVPGSEALSVLNPVFSPDGEMLAFFTTADRTLKTIASTGGTPTTLCKVAAAPFGMSWDATGIVFAENTGAGGSGIKRVSADGGEPELLAEPADSTTFFDGPQLLPGGEYLMFTESVAGPLRWDRGKIVAVSLKTKAKKTLIDGGSAATYLPTGHLIYAVAGVLNAVAFSPRSLTVGSNRVTIVEGIRRSGTSGAAHYSASTTGTLVYVPGPTTGVTESDLGISDRAGAVTPLKLPPDTYEHPRMSPDGKQLAFTTEDRGESNVSVLDINGGGPPRRLTFGGDNHFPIWSSDSRRVTFQSTREGDHGLFWQLADGTGGVERLTTPDKGQMHIPNDWSPKGDRLAFDVTRGTGAPVSLRMLSLPDRTIAEFDLLNKENSLLTTATFSPDGHWIAYTVGDESTAGVGAPGASMDVWVQPIPATGSRFQVYTKEGSAHHPLWARDKKELLFVGLPGSLWTVSVTTEPTFAFGNPTARPRAFSVAAPTTPRPFDITPDGRIVSAVTAAQSPASETRLAIVTNWFEELKAKVK